MILQEIHCPYCHSSEKKRHATYEVKSGETRTIYACTACAKLFSETKSTALEGLKTNLDTITKVLHSLNDGQSINAVCRVFGISKNTVRSWLNKFSNLKETLLLYSICQRFITQVIEGDELYTKVKKNTTAAKSEGWTIVLMDRASRFVWDLQCGEKDKKLFINAMEVVAQVIENTNEVSLFTDGERRYGNMLFEICHELIRTGKRGRPAKTFVKNLVVRVKNKGSQLHKTGPKKKKYQATKPEHPETTLSPEDKEIHANHLEAFNSGLRRKLSCYRRKTNTYAKNTVRLQIRLNVHWIFHNFICKHYTTKQVPSVAQGITEQALSVADFFRIQVFEKKTA